MIWNLFVVPMAFLADAVIGVPPWFPHPVRGIGHLAFFFEDFFRKRIQNEKHAGIAAAFSIIASGLAPAMILLFLADFLGDIASFACSAVIIYFSIAAGDLSNHALRVKDALDLRDMELARRMVSRMVGRDTDSMDESEIIRAAVESVAENTVDGVLSPLFWAFLLGPLGAFCYRIINTLDSMFGHKNERYLKFGWFPARLDDAANYIPARLGLLFFTIAAMLLGLDWKRSLITGIRDGGKHDSPNSGISEAAVAGALGVRLGGRIKRKGLTFENPFIGDPFLALDRNHIYMASKLMYFASIVFLSLITIAAFLCFMLT